MCKRNVQMQSPCWGLWGNQPVRACGSYRPNPTKSDGRYFCSKGKLGQVI